MNASGLPPAPGAQRAATRAVLHAGFIVTGAVTTLLGPILPLLIARWRLSDADAGLFFSLQFCGNLAGLAVLGTLLARRGYRFTLVLGFALMAAGVAALTAAGPFQARMCMFILGCGLGLTISGVNLWVGEDAGTEPFGRRAAALSLLNMTWGLGAVAFPPLVVLAQEEHLLPVLLLANAGLCGTTALFLALRGAEPRAVPENADVVPAGQGNARSRSLIVLGCLFFIYVGTEASVAGWTAALAQRISTMTSVPAGWALAPMFFWAGLLTGRALVPLLLRAMSERMLLTCGLAAAAAGTGAQLRTASFTSAAVCVAAAGLGMACVFPLLAAWMLAVLGVRARRGASVYFALGCAGGATLPWLVGLASTRAGSLRAGLLVPLAGCLVMLGLLSLLRLPGSAPTPSVLRASENAEPG
jgi:fucose permease